MSHGMQLIIIEMEIENYVYGRRLQSSSIAQKEAGEREKVRRAT